MAGTKVDPMKDEVMYPDNWGNSTATEVAMKQKYIDAMMKAQTQINPMLGGQLGTGSIYKTPRVPIYEPTFRVKKIRNGYILYHAKAEGSVPEQDYCVDLEEIGQRVIAILVQHQLENDK